MTKKEFRLKARVSTDNPTAIKSTLNDLVNSGNVKEGEVENEFIVEARMSGESAKDLNRSFLSALRKVEKKTRLRAEWTRGGTTEKFFDYVSKGTRGSTG